MKGMKRMLGGGKSDRRSLQGIEMCIPKGGLFLLHFCHALLISEAHAL